jgi:4-hydroxysphinganine ceramide fatty acyl 2-hydroxylase
MNAVALLRDIIRILSHRDLQRILLVYGLLAGALLAAAFWALPSAEVIALLAMGAVLFLPVEYFVHRFVLHPLIYLNSRALARAWVRMHYAHHAQPSRREVILASPGSVVGLFVATNAPVAAVAGPWAALPGAVALIVPFAFFYELVHFAAHQPIPFESGYFRRRRARHLLHHFRNDRCNFGICSSLFDRVFRTHAVDARAIGRAPTARNLGYDDAVASLKPLVRNEYERSLSR